MRDIDLSVLENVQGGFGHALGQGLREGRRSAGIGAQGGADMGVLMAGPIGWVLGGAVGGVGGAAVGFVRGTFDGLLK